MKRIGHDRIWDRLKSDIDAGRLGHAHLFLGPKHVGKTKLALNAAVELQEATENVVLKKQMYEGVDPDTILLLDEGENLSIKAIRDLIERSHQSHFRPHLVVIIENIGRMKAEAMNALLKTLEEPPEGTVFFLTANREEDVLPTIRSRCQVHSFHTVADALLREACANNVYVDQLVMFAMGRPGKLIRLMEDSDYLSAHQAMHEDVKRFLENPSEHAAFELARRYEKADQLQEMLDILLHRIRTYALSGQQPNRLAHLNWTEVLDSLEQVKQDLDRNVNKKLLLETLLLPFAH